MVACLTQICFNCSLLFVTHDDYHKAIDVGWALLWAQLFL